MMEQTLCPVCEIAVPSQEIERHVNDHFADEDLSRDLELAQQISFVPPSPPPHALHVDDASYCKPIFYETLPSTSSGEAACSIDACGGTDIDAKVCSLISMQVKEIFYRVEGGLMASLKNCLASESEKDATSILSGYVDHFQSREFEDVGWGCGWRNIQMLSSHLIIQRREARDLLYGGAGFVPDIASLQRWLEIAWELGFDTQGSNDFRGRIHGKRNWIGTTECAALFRSFGLRAMVVDFCSKETQSASSTAALNHGKMLANANWSKREIAQVYGPMDRFLFRRDHKEYHMSSTGSEGSSSTGSEGSKFSSCHVGKDESHGVIIDWVWNYFSDNNSTKPGSQRVVLSEKAPLYFQHDGHSRTIVGIQAIRLCNGMHKYNLLILDPAHPTEILAKSLRQNFGWQKLIKRGLHTLKKQQYQLCFIEPGMASGEEMNKLKILCGIRFEL